VLSARRAFLFEAVALAVILVLAAWLRLAGLDRTSLFGDEAVYSGQAAALAGLVLLARRSARRAAGEEPAEPL
jgi:hypothetical protein